MNADRPAATLLLVDDDADTVELLARVFRVEGFTVHTALGCRDALRTALAYGCDVLVSDLSLPDGDGCDLLRAIRAQKYVAAVAFTGHCDPRTHDRARSAGFERVVPKPVDADALVRVVRESLSKESRPSGANRAAAQPPRSRLVAPSSSPRAAAAVGATGAVKGESVRK